MIKKFNQFENEKKFVINDNKFQLFLNDILLTETCFNIEQEDEWFNEKYITLHDLKTVKNIKEKDLQIHY